MAGNPRGPWQVSEGSAQGLTPCGAVGPAFSVWSLGGVRMALPPCSDNKRVHFDPKCVLPYLTSTWCVTEHGVSALLQPVTGRRRGSPELVRATCGGVLWKEAQKATNMADFTESFLQTPVLQPAWKCPEKAGSGLGFRGTIYTVICIF